MTIYFSDGLKRPALVRLCQQYLLGTVGRKADLKARVKGFSENMIRWKWYVVKFTIHFSSTKIISSLIPGARCAHRGVRDGKVIKNDKHKETLTKVNKKAKLSTLRRDVM